jgi:hypothetical protein
MEERMNQPIRIAGAKLIVGLFFAVAGLLMTADNLDLIDASQYLRYWPAVVIAVGLIKLADPARRLAGFLLTLAGASLLAYYAGWVGITIFDLWPLLLIFGGALMVMRALGVRSIPEAGADDRNVWSILASRNVRNASSDFRAVRVGVFLGGCDLDLTHADIVDGPAVVETFAMMGGIRIFVPDDWEVIGEVVPVMAGFDVRTAPANPRRRLIVRGTALMAGIEVKRRNA